jgi:hypothetical protein
MRIGSFVTLLALSCLFAGMNQGKSPANACSRCKDVGTMPCAAHSGPEREAEKSVEFCAVVAACKPCRGTLEIDCDKCEIGDARWNGAVAKVTKWRDSLAEHEKLFGRSLTMAQSAHFEMTWEGGKAAKGKSIVSPHLAMHHYLDRCEALYEDFKKTLGCSDADFSTRFRIMVWQRDKDHRIAGANYCSQPNPDTSVKRMGYVGIYSVFLDPSKVDPDEDHGADLYRAMVHNVAHLLLANVWNAKWPGDTQGGWIDEGVAHYFEDKVDKRCTNFCYREQDSTQTFKGGRWRDPVKKLATSPNRPSFAETAIKRGEELTLEEHALVWSYCEFLIAKNGPAFGKICRAIKEGKGYRDPMKEGFGWNALSFEDEWKKHVKTYGK